jgi:hypothetical protein
MKTKLIVIAIIIFFSQTVLVAAQTWVPVNTLQNEWLQKIYTQGLDTIFIVGKSGLIAKSTDKTKTWSKQYTTGVTLNDVVFINHYVGFAVGANGTVLKTTDTGINWNQVTSGTTNNLNAIAATALDNIWIVGDGGLVIYSTDSGNNWTIKNFSTTSGLNDISFQNGLGYIVGTNKFSLKTVDSGKTWTENPINLPGSIPSSNDNLISAVQTPNHVYVLLGSAYMGHYMKIDNNFYPYASSDYYSSFSMLNDTVGFSVFANTTTNGDRIIKVYKMKNGSYVDEVRLYPTNGQLDYAHSDIKLVNDTIGYLISGSVLYENAKNPIDGIEETQTAPTIVLNEIGNEIVISSFSKIIENIEIYNISGSRISYLHGLNSMSQKIPTTNFGKGTYIVQTIFSDKSKNITKWIKL